MDVLLEGGPVDEATVSRVTASEPEIREVMVSWLREFISTGDWIRFGRFINLAAYIRPNGLGELIREVLDSDLSPVNREDLVEILGEIQDSCAVSVLVRIFEHSWPGEMPFPSLSRKCIEALGAIGTEESFAAARRIAVNESYPSPLRWYAAIELGIEDELGFDEDEMLCEA
ncbi:HEAT repeat domain-containing protein [Wenjunlia vitaminophila]|nr:HEAT repeat domain-containing protein [Wenjunlia vitaminophila]